MRATVLSIFSPIFFVLAMTVSAHAFCQSILDSPQKVEVYSASIEIYRGGVLVSKPNVTLPGGKMARVEVANDKDPDSGIRLDLTVSDAGFNRKKDRQARISAVVHEKVGGGLGASQRARNRRAAPNPQFNGGRFAVRKIEAALSDRYEVASCVVHT